MANIQLSVIIPTRNRQKDLYNTLQALTKQTMSVSAYEIIVIDNGSTDDTKQVCQSFQGFFPNLIYCYDATPGLHTGRHLGLKKATSDILVYIDDDVEPFAEWLVTIQDIFSKNPDVALVGGKNLPKFEQPPPFWLLEMWNKKSYIGKVLGELSIIDLGEEPIEIPPYYVFGCNFSVRKRIVLEAGGFHPDGMPFDLIHFRGDGETYISDYIRQRGLKTIYHPKASVFHLVSKDRMTLDYFKRRNYSQGISDAYTKLRSGNIDKPITVKQKIMKILKISAFIEFIRVVRESAQLTDFQKEVAISYKLGYQFLIDKYRSDETVRNWVHKENYM